VVGLDDRPFLLERHQARLGGVEATTRGLQLVVGRGGQGAGRRSTGQAERRRGGEHGHDERDSDTSSVPPGHDQRGY
jgi:hypothetical protein